MDQYKIGRFIAEKRKQKNMTQEALGEKVCVCFCVCFQVDKIHVLG